LATEVEEEMDVDTVGDTLLEMTLLEVDVVTEVVTLGDEVLLLALEEKETEGKTISHEASNKVNKVIGTNNCFLMVFINLILSFLP
jgi:thiamine biosynthesis protein ThiC